MNDLLNVFEHERFRLRGPDGSRVEKTFRDLLTEPDTPYALDYAQAFYDVAALNLLSFLAQLAFEPADADELARRLEAPLTAAEFEDGIAPLRPRCALNGDGPRFMQAPGPFDAERASGLDLAVFITSAKPNATQSDKRFLFRSDPDWAVPPDRAGLFLFARNTFYEGTAGRGYQKGTNGDTPVRVLVTDPADGDALWLRRTVWLNVVSRAHQREYSGAYARPDNLRDGDYDGLFWSHPPTGDVPTGSITLRAGLGWMSANHWLWYEEGEGICPLTGERVSGTVARTASKRSTGVGFGAKGDIEAGIRADRLFRHPNVPTRKRYGRQGEIIGEDPFRVERIEGLTAAIGAAFFGGRSEQDGSAFVLAPAVDQVQSGPIRRSIIKAGRQPSALVFGFHMLSNQRNVHGGIEQDAFGLPLLGSTPEERFRIMVTASKLMRDAGAFAEQAARNLGLAVQRTSGAGVRAEVTDDGAIRLSKLEATPSVDDPFGRDTLAEFWRSVRRRLLDHAGTIVQAAAGGPDALVNQEEEIRGAWEERVIREVRDQYRPVFEHHSTLPRTMPYAHAAQRMLFASLNKLRSIQPETA
jgi:hypothetical protein